MGSYMGISSGRSDFERVVFTSTVPGLDYSGGVAKLCLLIQV